MEHGENISPRQPDSKIHGFLLKRFTIFSVISAISILLLVTAGIYKSYRKHIIVEAERDAANLGRLLSEYEYDMLFSYDSDGEANISLTEADFPSFDRRMRKYLKLFDVAKIKIFSINRPTHSRTHR